MIRWKQRAELLVGHVDHLWDHISDILEKVVDRDFGPDPSDISAEELATMNLVGGVGVMRDMKSALSLNKMYGRGFEPPVRTNSTTRNEGSGHLDIWMVCRGVGRVSSKSRGA